MNVLQDNSWCSTSLFLTVDFVQLYFFKGQDGHNALYVVEVLVLQTEHTKGSQPILHDDICSTAQ